jgi:hypothetical protein
MGLAQINLGGERTAVPDVGGYYYTLTFTADGQPAVVETLEGSLTFTVALNAGAWNLDVKGYTDSGMSTLNVRGSRSIPIASGSTSNFDVYLTLEFSAEGKGSLSYSIGLPATVSRGFFALSPINALGTLDYLVTSQEIDISASAGGSATGNLSDLPEESYLALIDLYDGTNNKATVRTRGGTYSRRPFTPP